MWTHVSSERLNEASCWSAYRRIVVTGAGGLELSGCVVMRNYSTAGAYAGTVECTKARSRVRSGRGLVLCGLGRCWQCGLQGQWINRLAVSDTVQ